MLNEETSIGELKNQDPYKSVSFLRGLYILADMIASINPAFLRISISLIPDKFCLFFISSELSFMSTHPPLLFFFC